MGKAPAFQFYPNDWSHDLEEHSLEIEGAWIRICCKLWWSETRGQLNRTIDQWAKILRLDETNCQRILNYIETWKIGDIQRTSNGEVTIISRRMLRDEIDRQNNALRQQRFKDKHRGNDSVTPSVTAKSQRSSSSSSIIYNNKEKISTFNCGKVKPKYYKDERGNYVCSLCQKPFMEYQNLQDHFKEHKGD
jgi:hypothetical protein